MRKRRCSVDLRKLSLLIEALRKILVNLIETLMNSKDSERLLIVKKHKIFISLKKTDQMLLPVFYKTTLKETSGLVH